MVAEAIGVIEFREVASKLGEMARTARCCAWPWTASSTRHGRRPACPVRPDGVWMAQTTWRMTELLREICGSGIVMQPSENDLANPELRPSWTQFMRGKDVDVEYKSRLFRVAHDLAMSSLRHAPGHLRVLARRRPEPQPHQPAARVRPERHDRAMIKDLCSRPLPHGEVP